MTIFAFVDLISEKAYFWGLTTMMYITAAIVLAAVRWFHMCRPYDRNAKYYYPGRPFMTVTFISSLVLLPYVADPCSIDAWILVKFYFLPMHIFLMTQMLDGYFSGVMRLGRRRRTLVLTGLPPVLLLLCALALAILPGEQLADQRLLHIAHLVNYLLGAISTVICMFSLRKVRAWAMRFDEDEYSNPMDFPVKFARGTISLILTCLVLLWVSALTDNRFVMSGMMLLLIVVIVALMIASLHPNRHRKIEDTEIAGDEAALGRDADTDSVGSPIPEKTAEEVLLAIRKVVETEKAFLDPHLTLNDVAVRSGYNRTYVARIIKTEFGGFFQYINSLRLDYADDYKQLHPGATVSEIVFESGFGSRQTYYNVKSRLRPEGRE